MPHTQSSKPSSNSQHSSGSPYSKAIKRIRTREGGTYFYFCHDFLKLDLTCHEAVALLDMFNWAHACHAECHDGWFKYTVELMEGRVKATPRTQVRIIRRLMELRYIKMMLFGRPPSRHLCINIEKVVDDLEEAL